jgi:hypothetical protein
MLLGNFVSSIFGGQKATRDGTLDIGELKDNKKAAVAPSSSSNSGSGCKDSSKFFKAVAFSGEESEKGEVTTEEHHDQERRISYMGRSRRSSCNTSSTKSMSPSPRSRSNSRSSSTRSGSKKTSPSPTKSAKKRKVKKEDIMHRELIKNKKRMSTR